MSAREAIQARMEQVRNDLRIEVDEVVEQAREMTDWRGLASKHPWVTLGAAAAVGFLLVPRKLHVMSPDVATLEKLAEKNQLVVKSHAGVRHQARAANPLINMLVGAVMRSAMTVVGQRVGAIITESGIAPKAEAPARDERVTR